MQRTGAAGIVSEVRWPLERLRPLIALTLGVNSHNAQYVHHRHRRGRFVMGPDNLALERYVIEHGRPRTITGTLTEAQSGGPEAAPVQLSALPRLHILCVPPRNSCRRGILDKRGTPL